jgi:hypothetical protein
MQAQMQMNVEQLADFVRSELALQQHSDKQIAAYVKKIKLTEKLTDKTILDLEAQKAGPKTVQALQELRDETASLKPPTHDSTYSPATVPDTTVTGDTAATARLNVKAPPIPPPDSVRQQKMLDLMKQYALSYTQNLPNFICVEVIRRYIDPNAGDHYRSIGNILAKVSYNQGRENYKVYSVNGQYSEVSLEQAASSGGAISNGEFGSMMRELFEDKSAAEFGWDHWATLRGRRMAVFNYFIDSGHSNYSISYGSGAGEQRIVTAYKGLIYADENTGEISRIKLVAVDIPHSFPVSEAAEILDYDLVEISGQQYVCPLMAKVYLTAGRDKTKNEIEFRSYRKFGTETNITYDMNPNAPPPEPLPPNKTEEQPATASTGTTPVKPGQPEAPKSSKPASTSNTNPFGLPTALPPPPPQ